MSKLLHRANTKLALAQYSIERINEDDAFLDSACFEIQQSIEFALKYWIELSGLGYSRTHDIANLIAQLVAHGERAEVLQELNNNANLYTSWEARSRCYDDFCSTIHDVTIAAELAAKLIDLLKSYSSNDEKDEDFIAWCNEFAPEAIKSRPMHEMLEIMRPIYEAQNSSQH